MEEKNSILVVMGSRSDLETMKSCLELLDQFQISYTARILSAHRTPRAVLELAESARDTGCKAIIAAAGLAAHLAGFLASSTIVPVIAVPMAGGPLNGLDALLSTVQMPGGVPVACMAIGKPGARNAALYAAQILALQDDSLAEKLIEYKEEMKNSVLEQSKL